MQTKQYNIYLFLFTKKWSQTILIIYEPLRLLIFLMLYAISSDLHITGFGLVQLVCPSGHAENTGLM